MGRKHEAPAGWEGPPDENRHGLAWAVLFCIALELLIVVIVWALWVRLR